MKILKNVFFSLLILLVFTNNFWSKSASEFISTLSNEASTSYQVNYQMMKK